MNTKQKALETGSFKCFLLELLARFELATSSLPKVILHKKHK